jgi:chromosome segregation ATPase
MNNNTSTPEEDEEDDYTFQVLRDQLETAAKMGMELYENAEESETRANSAEQERDDTLAFCAELREELSLLKSERDRFQRKTALLNECLDDLESDNGNQRQEILSLQQKLEHSHEENILLVERANESDYHKEAHQEKQAATAWKLAISRNHQKNDDKMKLSKT